MTFPPPSGALEVLERMRAAAITRSAADMSSVYAAQRRPRVPLRPAGRPGPDAEGRDAIMSFVTAFWSDQPAAV